MKSFFKKIALVLVLAMVVTMLPAKAVSAADADGPQLSKQVKLYIGGDKSGSYSDTAYAKVWNKAGYTVEFSSSDETVATVGKKKGLVTAVGVGSATITAVFTNEDGEEVTKTCPVVVKKNAVAVGISDNSAKKLEEGLAVGETFQPKVYRTSADDVTTWKGKDVITDGARFESSDEKVFTVKKTTGKITAVGVGEATLSVWTVQGEKPVRDENGKVVEYLATTDKVEYPVKVLAGTIVEVKQTKVDTFEILCSDEKVASEITAENLAVATVANGVEVKTFVKSVAVDKKVVAVTLHNSIETGVTYKVAYGEVSLEFVGAELAPAKIEIVTSSVEARKDDAKVDIVVYNAAGVDITSASDIDNRVTISAPESTDYYVNSSTRNIYFFNENKVAHVTAVYDMLWDEQGNDIQDLKAEADITSYALSVTNGNITAWLVTKAAGDAQNADKFHNNQITLAAGDDGFVLYGMYVKTTGSNTENKFTAAPDGIVFTYSSTNESVLLVDPNTAQLYPVAKGSASVIVKAGDSVVGVCNINIVESRTFGLFTVSADKNILSAGSLKTDKVTIELTVKDQLGDDITSYNVTPRQIPLTNSPDIVNWTQNGNKFEITANANATEKVTTVYMEFKVEVGGVEKVQRVPISVKKVDVTKVSTYKINLRDSIDLKLDATKYGNGEYNSVITVDLYDSMGYYINTIDSLTNVLKDGVGSTEADAYSFKILKNGQDLGAGDAVVSGSSISTVVVSGGSELVKTNTGSYVVQVYRGEGGSTTQPRLVGSTVINVSDSTAPITVVQKAQDASNIFGSLTFMRGNEEVKNLTFLEMDATETASGTFVRTITVYEKIGDYNYKVVVSVYKLFK